MKIMKLIYKNLYIKIALAFMIGLLSVVLIYDYTALRIPIFGFHAIVNLENQNDQQFIKSDYKSMIYERQKFEVFLGNLIQNKYWFLTTQELYEYFITKSKPIPTDRLGYKPIMLSFDDGYKNMYTNLIYSLERLENKYKQKVKVVLFINPGTLANYKSNASLHMTCEDLRDGYAKGYYDIQSHGFSHQNLTKIPQAELVNELARAQADLKQCLSGLDSQEQVAKHIAYPYGAANKKVEESAAKYYLSGYLYNSRMFKLGRLSSNYRIPRLTVNQNHTPERLIKISKRALKLSQKDIK